MGAYETTAQPATGAAARAWKIPAGWVPNRPARTFSGAPILPSISSPDVATAIMPVGGKHGRLGRVGTGRRHFGADRREQSARRGARLAATGSSIGECGRWGTHNQLRTGPQRDHPSADRAAGRDLQCDNSRSTGASELAVSADGTHRVLDLAAGSLQLSGLTIRDGQAVLGGGVLVEAGTTAQISNCAFTDNTATEGGGIFATKAQLTVTGCTFTNNVATDGGGIYPDFTALTLTQSTFTGNQSFYGGSGVFVFGSPAASVDRCAFLGGQAADAALSFTHTPAGAGAGNSVVTNCLLVGNVSGGAGAILGRQPGGRDHR